MIKINLLPDEIRRGIRLRRERRYLIIGGVMALVLSVLLSLAQVGLLFGAKARAASLENKYESLAGIRKEMEEVRRLSLNINLNTKFSSKLIEKRTDWLAIIKDLFDATSKKVWYDSLYFRLRSGSDFKKEGYYDIVGYVNKKNHKVALDLTAALKQKTDYFQDAIYKGGFEREETFKKQSGNEYIPFKISGE